MLIQDKKTYEDVIAGLLSDGLIAIDSETEEFSKTKTHSFQLALDGIGVYSKNIAAYIPSRILDSSFQKVIDNCELIFHNAKFDLTILEKQGFDISKVRYHDTLVMAWLVNENRYSFGLKYLAESILKVSKDKIVEFRNVKKRPVLEEYGMFPDSFDEDSSSWLEELAEYCISDCKYTYKLFHKFKPELEEQGLWKVYTELEIPFSDLLRRMENRGIKLDTEYLKKIGSEMEQDLVKIQADIWKLAGKEVDINSPKKLSEFFQGVLKYDLPDDLRTDKGGYSTNVNVLKYFVAKYDCKISKGILSFRETFKLHSTYVKGLLERQSDGVIYTSFLQQGTQTGRLSSRNPNLQNIPRRADKFDIRQAFVAREGYTFIISDLSQIELRLAAYFSKDPTLLKAYQEGKDIHQETADALGLCCEKLCRSCVKCKEGRNLSKCFSAGTLINTSKGGILIEELVNHREDKKHVEFKVNCHAKDHNSKYNKINSTYYEKNVKDWIEFELASGDKIEVTPDHRMLVLRDGNAISCDAKDVRETDEFIEY